VTIKFVNKLTRDIDRKLLKLKINYEEDRGEGEMNNEKYKQIIDKWLTEDTIIAKIFRFIRDYPDGVSKTELEDFIKRKTNTINVSQQYLEIYRSDLRNIFQRDNNQITKLTEKAKKYLSNKQ
jgi:uncharacterized protein YutE (UPF0331/DUF86 family)